MLSQNTVSVERQAFEDFLAQVKTLMQRKSIKFPSGFISYAWEDLSTDAGKIANKTLQDWLVKLKEDFELLGIDLFLDVQNMNGDMQECMKFISKSDFVLSIGTPRFKERIEQDALYLLPTFNPLISPTLLPSKGNAVVLTENDDTVRFIENGQFLPDDKNISRDFNLSNIEWVQEPGYKRAKISNAVNVIIKKAIHQISTRNITNAAFEFGLTLDKGKRSPNALMPLLYHGDFHTAFPKDMLTRNLIRSFLDPNGYYQSLVGLTPLGLLPAICPQLQKDQDYKRLVSRYLRWDFNAWESQVQNTFSRNKDLALYISTRGSLNIAYQNSQLMEDHLQDFLHTNSAKVLLLLGNAGSGKTIFSQHFCQRAIQHNFTPLWISLSSIRNPKEHLMQEILSLYGVLECHFEFFKQKPLLIILDGYDQTDDLGNLYNSNHLEQWNIKLVITCRTEYLTIENYDDFFKPRDGDVWERHIVPFLPQDISDYLKNYIALQKPRWDLEKYEEKIKQLPNLKELIKNPLLLHMVADMLPNIMDECQNQNLNLVIYVLYRKLMNRWFNQHLQRWKEQGKLPLLDESLNLNKSLQEQSNQRLKALYDYAQAFACRLHNSHLEIISIKNPLYPWVQELFDPRARSALIRSACPLQRVGEDSYGFIDKSLLKHLATSEKNKISKKEKEQKSEVASVSSNHSNTNTTKNWFNPLVWLFSNRPTKTTVKENATFSKSIVFQENQTKMAPPKIGMKTKNSTIFPASPVFQRNQAKFTPFFLQRLAKPSENVEMSSSFEQSKEITVSKDHYYYKKIDLNNAYIEASKKRQEVLEKIRY